MARVAVIGAGWYGCHIACALLDSGVDVTLYDKSQMFSGISSRNQNRLHLGFHYPRSYKTRSQNKAAFPEFHKKYGDCVIDLQENYYAIHKDSIIDFETFQSIYKWEGFDFEIVPQNQFPHLSAFILVDEKIIDPVRAKSKFESKLGPWFVNEKFDTDQIDAFDFVVDCSCGEFSPLGGAYYYERFAYLEVSVSDPLPSLIVMDGPFFSIYPTADGRFTVTHVTKGILGASNNRNDLVELYCDEQSFGDDMLASIEHLAGRKIFSQINSRRVIYTIKVKSRRRNDERIVDVRSDDRLITVIPGKIEAVFKAEDIVRQVIGL